MFRMPHLQKMKESQMRQFPSPPPPRPTKPTPPDPESFLICPWCEGLRVPTPPKGKEQEVYLVCQDCTAAGLITKHTYEAIVKSQPTITNVGPSWDQPVQSSHNLSPVQVILDGVPYMVDPGVRDCLARLNTRTVELEEFVREQDERIRNLAK